MWCIENCIYGYRGLFINFEDILLRKIGYLENFVRWIVWLKSLILLSRKGEFWLLCKFWGV